MYRRDRVPVGRVIIGARKNREPTRLPVPYDGRELTQ